MKKMKECGKLDINKQLTNHSARQYLLQKLRENNVEGTDTMQISGHKNVASINNYSTLSEERHKKISNILSNTETNRMAVSPRTNFLYE
jgi:type V secretory pathway adhesin AidA